MIEHTSVERVDEEKIIMWLDYNGLINFVWNQVNDPGWMLANFERLISANSNFMNYSWTAIASLPKQSSRDCKLIIELCGKRRVASNLDSSAISITACGTPK